MIDWIRRIALRVNALRIVSWCNWMQRKDSLWWYIQEVNRHESE